jgi:hypothetical protein
MAKTNTWYYSWFILLGLCINTNTIICCCYLSWTKTFSCYTYICFISSNNVFTSFLKTSSIFCYSITSVGWCSSSMNEHLFSIHFIILILSAGFLFAHIIDINCFLLIQIQNLYNLGLFFFYNRVVFGRQYFVFGRHGHQHPNEQLFCHFKVPVKFFQLKSFES